MFKRWLRKRQKKSNFVPTAVAKGVLQELRKRMIDAGWEIKCKKNKNAKMENNKERNKTMKPKWNYQNTVFLRLKLWPLIDMETTPEAVANEIRPQRFLHTAWIP